MGRKGKELSIEVRNLIIKSHKTNGNVSNLSRTLGIPRSTVKSVIKKFNQHSDVKNLPGRGRKSLFMERDTNQLSRIVKENRRRTYKDITGIINENRDHQFCTKTVERKIRKLGYVRRVAKKKVAVREVNKKERVKWCKERKNWTVQQEWSKWIFSDESQIVIGDNKTVYIWRKGDEKYNPQLVCPAPRRRFSVMIWGCVCFQGVGTLTAVQGNINAQKYLQIIDNNIWPVIAQHFPDNNYIFMDDNAPVHRAKTVKDYMTVNNIKTTKWPAQSPDLNIIENIWLHLKRTLDNRVHFINSQQDLMAEIRTVWENIQINYIQDLYSSIPGRLKEVIRMKGNLTKY